MKLIIDIPNFIYQTLIETGKYGFYRFDAKKAIKKGTSLDRVFDNLKAEIEHMIPCSKETLSMKLGVLEIIDKYRAESEVEE